MLEKSTGSCLHIAVHVKQHANNQHRLLHLRRLPAPPQFSDPEVSRGSALGYRDTRCQGYAISIFKTANSQRNKKRHSGLVGIHTLQKNCLQSTAPAKYSINLRAINKQETLLLKLCSHNRWKQLHYSITRLRHCALCDVSCRCRKSSNSDQFQKSPGAQRPLLRAVSRTEVDQARSKPFCAIKLSDNILIASLIWAANSIVLGTRKYYANNLSRKNSGDKQKFWVPQ